VAANGSAPLSDTLPRKEAENAAAEHPTSSASKALVSITQGPATQAAAPAPSKFVRFVEIATALLDIVSIDTKADEGNVRAAAERRPMFDVDAITDYRSYAAHESAPRQPQWGIHGLAETSSCSVAFPEPRIALRTMSTVERHVAQHLAQMNYSLVSRLDSRLFSTGSIRDRSGLAADIGHVVPEMLPSGSTSPDTVTAAAHYTVLLAGSGDEAGYREFAEAFVREGGQRLDELRVNVYQDLQTTSSDKEPPTEAKIVEDLAKQLVPHVKHGVENRIGYAALSNELDRKLDKIIDEYHRLVIAAAN